MTMQLFYSPGACSLSPHIVARELGLDLSLQKVDLGTKKVADGSDFFAVNPKGYVPAVRFENGDVLTEGPAITQYLADQHPDAKLLPAVGTLARARVQEMLAFIGTEIHKSYGPLFNPSVSPEVRADRHAYLQKRYAHIESVLGTEGYLFGEQFTVADAYLFTVTNWAAYVKLDLTAFPKLAAFQGRVAARPAVQAALVAEGLAKLHAGKTPRDDPTRASRGLRTEDEESSDALPESIRIRLPKGYPRARVSCAPSSGALHDRPYSPPRLRRSARVAHRFRRGLGLWRQHQRRRAHLGRVRWRDRRSQRRRGQRRRSQRRHGRLGRHERGEWGNVRDGGRRRYERGRDWRRLGGSGWNGWPRHLRSQPRPLWGHGLRKPRDRSPALRQLYERVCHGRHLRERAVRVSRGQNHLRRGLRRSRDRRRSLRQVWHRLWHRHLHRGRLRVHRRDRCHLPWQRLHRVGQ
jgi:glutathione S-transferase